MKVKTNISVYRERLDKTLASNDLTNVDTLKTLIKNQLKNSSQFRNEGYSDNVVEKRTTEVSNFLDMLRSASVSDDEATKTREIPHGGWKLKQDTEECRVMYREGPEGTPFHTLLVEGYVDGPMDISLCVSWESTLFKKWWPQLTVPTFKIMACQCLQKIRIGEHISLVRMKVSWPLSAREAVIHFFAFEYFQDDLVVVLLNSIPELENIDSSHGFTKDGIPEAKDIVRIDVVGGFALQKVNSERSYFRTIANMDIKLDFVPPSLINFMSRQIVGNGFKLYQKAISAVSKGDEDFGKALTDPLYVRIREALYSPNNTNEALYQEETKSNVKLLPQEQHEIITTPNDSGDSLPENELSPENLPATDRKTVGEIEEEESEEIRDLDDAKDGICKPPSIQIPKKCIIGECEKNVLISPRVEQALQVLEKAISYVRDVGFDARKNSPFGCSSSEKCEESETTSNNVGVCLANGSAIPVSVDTNLDGSGNCDEIRDSRHKGMKSYSKEVNLNRIAPAASPEMNPLPTQSHYQVSLLPSQHAKTHEPFGAMLNKIHDNALDSSQKSRQPSRSRNCCFPFLSTPNS